MQPAFKRILARFGIRNAYDQERHDTYERLRKQLEILPAHRDSAGSELIIFSKDRAIQLDALLRSYFHYADHPIPVKVLYNASQPAYQESYADLQQSYQSQGVTFIEEHGFKADLVSLFQSLSCAKVLFLVDDMLFKQRVDMRLFTAIDTQKYIPCLRLGNHLSYAYTLEREQALPSLKPSAAHHTMLTWDWARGDGDWAYPLSVDGNLFDREEMLLLVEELDYKAPNSFEEALQIMSPYYKKRSGLCYGESVIINNPCNKVQTENENVSGEISIEALDAKWKAGYRINFEQFEGLKNKSAHQELSYTFVKR